MPNIVAESLATVHVAVAVIERFNPQGLREILIAKRPVDVHQGGLWEFPGGKLEQDETLIDGLARELKEELGIRLLGDSYSQKALHPLIQIAHDYGDKQVLLDVLCVKAFEGEAEGKEGQEIRWVRPERLVDYDFPAANHAIVSACNLPGHYAISPSYASLELAIEGIGELLTRHSMLLFRQPQLELNQYQYWSQQILARYQSSPAKILLSGSPSALGGLCADGVQAPYRTVKDLAQRPVSNSVLFGVSCHNGTEIKQAQRLSADFITLSPVLPTRTHPEAVALGWTRFAELVRAANVPVFALGGLTKQHQLKAMNAGAQGIAGIRLWQNHS